MTTTVIKKRGVYHHTWTGKGTGHAPLAPSDSNRWIPCSGSHHLTRRLRKKLLIPPDRAGKAAAEGTLAHWILEQCGIHGYRPEQYLGQKHNVEGFNFIVDTQMVTGVDIALEHFADIHFFNKVEVDNTEAWLSLEHLDIKHLEGGTVDRLLYLAKPKELHVVDFKYGRAHVNEYTSSQIKIYGVAALHLHPAAKSIHLTIIQPRSEHGNAVRTYVMTRKELTQWADEILIPRAKAVHTERHSFTITEQGCKYCPCRSFCPAREQLVKLAQQPAEWLTTAEKLRIFHGRKTILHTIKQVEEELTYEVAHLKHQNELKLVRKNTQRRVNAEAAEKHLGKDAYKPTLINVGEAEALIKERNISATDIITKPLGGPELANLADSREPLAKAEFKHLIED